MSNNFEVSVSTDDDNRNLTVLRIASAAKNSATQFYSERVQVSLNSLGDLNRKILEKLRLHRIQSVQAAITVQFESDKTVTFASFEDFKVYDLKTDALTNLLSLKWSFVFAFADDDCEHVHSIYVRISERPSPGLIFQKVFSGHSEDIDSLDNEAFSPIVCKIDFIDSRFSGELQSVVTEWVSALPKAEHTFEIMNWLNKNEHGITSFISGTLPIVVILAYVGIWFGIVPLYITNSVRYAAAWILGGGAVFLMAKYIANTLNKFFNKRIRRICNVPVFDITAGDGNRITKFMAKSQSSLFSLATAAVFYGIFKGLGLYFVAQIIKVFFE